MDENTNTQAEQTANQQDAFLNGWDDEPIAETAAEPAQVSEPAKEEADANGTATENETATASETAAETETVVQDGSKTSAAEKTETQAPKEWAVKHNKQPFTMKADDITTELLQKGLDYDRIREKYDEAKPVMDLFTDYAKQAGMNIPEYVKYVRKEAKKAAGMSDEEAGRAVELEAREAAVSAKEAEQQQEKADQEAAAAKVQADLAEFAQAFPEVYEQAKSNPKAIPESVWQDVNAGKLSLTAAYARYATTQAKQAAKVAADAQQTNVRNNANAARSTGSMKSAGNDSRVKDPFLEAFAD